MSKSSSILFTPLKLGDELTLKNRVIMAPLTRGRTGLSTGNRVPTSLNAEYYQQRAGAGLIITEATAISDQGFGWYGAPALTNDEEMKGWKQVTEAVHKKDGKIFFQMWHEGRQSHSSLHNGVAEIVAPSAIAVPSGQTHSATYEYTAYETPRALLTDEIAVIVNDYINSAKLASLAGFDGVEIHAANGYLIDTFLQSETNLRTDKYGGSMENRYRFLDEVVQGVLTVFKPKQVGIRISPNGVYGGMGSSDNDVMFPFVASQLSKYELAYLHVMDGLNFGFHQKCNPVNLYQLKQAFKGVVFGNISYTKEQAEGAIRTGAVDAVTFGRLYISNPDLAERFENDWSLAPAAEHPTWYGDNAEKDGKTGKFYTDFPTYPQQQEQEKQQSKQ